jgi:hypothetical protein
MPKNLAAWYPNWRPVTSAANYNFNVLIFGICLVIKIT